MEYVNPETARQCTARNGKGERCPFLAEDLEFSLCRGCRWRRARTKERQRRRALEILGGVCAHCGEKNPWAITFDHKHGGGNAHRERNVLARNMERWVVRNPGRAVEEIQLLCGSCHLKKGREDRIRAWESQ